MTIKKMKVHSVDHGFCRVNYMYRNPKGERFYYCIQDNGKQGVEVYRCSKDGEPSHPVKFKDSLIDLFELAQSDDSSLVQLVNEYIKRGQL